MKGPIAWFIHNGIAANLLLLMIMAGGLLTIPTIRKEVFPEFSSDMISISAVYRGAAPEEVENAICVRIEEAVHGVDGIDRIRSTASEGIGSVLIELLPGADTRRVLDDVKAQVDAIDTFPVETEQPIVQEIILRTQVISVAVSGDADEWTLKRIGEQVRDELSSLPDITQVQLVVARPYEIAIEIAETALRRHALTFDEIARAVRRSSLDLPGGSIRTDGGEFLLRVKGQAHHAPEFERIPLRTLPDGSRLRLGDVARVIDGFEEDPQAARFDGLPAVVVQVFRVGNQNPLVIADTVKAYIQEANARMPTGIRLTAYQDYSQYLESRMDLLLRNGRNGFILVFLVLALFLRFRLAFWVSLGIPLSFLGTLWLLPALDVSLNMLSLFAFVLVLGIVVDNAIVVGENIYSHNQRGKQGVHAALDGTRQVLVPVVFAICTTIAAFLPMLMVEGNTGKVLRDIPLIVIPTLVFSLVICLCAVPHHLTRLRPAPKAEGEFHPLRRFQAAFREGLERFVQEVYQPVIKWCLHWRYLTLAIGLSSLLLAAGFVGGGWLRFQFFPPVEGDDIAAFVTMPEGVSPDIVRQAVHQIEAAALQLRREYEEPGGQQANTVFRHMLASIGDQPYRTAVSRHAGGSGRTFARPNVAEVHIQLVPSEQRTVLATEIVNRWRQLTGEIPGAVELLFTSSLFSSGNPIDIQLTGPDVQQLREAAEELKAALAQYEGVFDIADSYRTGKPEITLAILPSAEAAGLTLEDLARQVRQAFHGEEAQRIQRGRDDLRVMIRYPPEERRSLGNLEGMRVRLPDGTELPFSAVARADTGRGYSNIERVDRQRSIRVTADVDLGRTSSSDILRALQTRELADLLARYPGLRYEFEGEQRQQIETLTDLARGFVLALVLIFALLGIPLRSYLHPLVVMSAIPFGFFGAILGHMIMGLYLTVLSMFGFVALAGVAVNASLIIVDFMNRLRREGVALHDAVVRAGMSRFRPVLLTSLTTFAGLTPLLMERSVQAQFLIPMAVSLGFGVLYCTFTTLLLVPVQYLIAEDASRLLRRLFNRTEPVREDGAPGTRESPATAQ